MAGEFDAVGYVAAAETILETLTDVNGSVSFQRIAGLKESANQRALIELSAEHEYAETAAAELLEREYPDKTWQEIDAIAQVVGHVSRAIAVLQARGGEQPRFAALSLEEQGAVIGVVLFGDRREPNSHMPSEALNWQPGA